MKGKGVKMTSLLIALLLVFLSACSGQPSSTSEPSNNNDTTKETKTDTGKTEDKTDNESGGEPASKDLYVIKTFTDSRVTNKIKFFSDTTIGKVIKDKFNIDFEFVPFPAGGDIKQNWNLMLAGGNYPEIVYTKCECLDTFKKYLQAGAVLPLDPYLDDMPNFKNLYKEALPYWKHAAGDGKLYNWNVATPQDKYNWLESNDILIRGDILEEAGYPELLTPDQYVELLANAIKKHPQTNGQKTIGMVGPFGEEWGMAGIAPILYEKAYNVQVANSAVIWNQKDEIWMDMFKDPYTKESFQFLNKLYRSGALDEESFTDKAPQSSEKLKSGRALAAWYITWEQSGANKELENAGHPELEYVKLPIMPQGAVDKGEKNWTPLQATRPFDWVFMTKNAKDPKRIMELVEWASSDEGQVLLQSGVEGVHYTMKDGKRFPTDAYLNGIETDPDYGVKEGFGVASFIGWAMINSPKDNTPYDMSNIPEVKDRSLTPREKEIYKAMGWESSQDWWLKNAEAKPVGLAAGIVVDPATSFGALEAKLTDFRVKNTPKLIKAKSDEEFEKIYNDLMKDYDKMNPGSLVDEYNRMYKEALDDLKKYE
jgi:putative aldouronate transport system substrate-binding protein